jgi:SOS-response transcriptional repressor LexA
MSNLSERIYRITRRHPTLTGKAKLAEALHCSRSMLYNYESDNPAPPREFLDKLAALEVTLDIGEDDGSSVVQETKMVYGAGARRIPVVGWAHAGQAGTYDEISQDWRRFIASDCRDAKAFAVTLEGDSMEPNFKDGDHLVLMPGEEAYSGCLAVCRFVDDGVLFRRLEFMGAQVRLMPLNERYPTTIHERAEFSWIYPVWESRRQIWK